MQLFWKTVALYLVLFMVSLWGEEVEVLVAFHVYSSKSLSFAPFCLELLL